MMTVMSITNSAIAFYGVAWVHGTSTEPGPLTEIDEQTCYDKNAPDEVKDCIDILRENDVYVGKYGNSFTGNLHTYLYIPESRISTDYAQPIKTGGYMNNWQERMDTCLRQLGIDDDPTLTPSWYVATELS